MIVRRLTPILCHPFSRHPGAGRDPRFKLPGSGAVGPGLRRDGIRPYSVAMIDPIRSLCDDHKIVQIPADPLLAGELSDDIVVDMANLSTAQTGIAGTIFISTAMGPHGPRVKYFLQPGRTQRSFSVSIADPPSAVANSLPAPVVRQMSPQVIEWVSRNKDALLDFWHHGDTWTQPEVNDFVQRLQRA